MKKQFIIITAIAIAFASCGNDQATSVARNQTHGSHAEYQAPEKVKVVPVVKPATPVVVETNIDFTPDVDTSKVKNWNDYQSIKSNVWQRYQDRKAAAWHSYTAEKAKFWNEFSKCEKDELAKFRSEDKESYLQWLDAEKINDYHKQRTLETTIPSLIAYKKITDTQYKLYENGEKQAYKVYEKTEGLAYKVYEAEEGMAYKAYEKRK